MNRDIRISFVGDSFVNGIGDQAGLGRAGRLCVWAMAKGLPITYYNLGIRSDTIRDATYPRSGRLPIRRGCLSGGAIMRTLLWTAAL